MPHFVNITVVKKANIYFEGKVTSRTIIFPDGSRKTLGIMLPGEYEFSTRAAEKMEILAGNLKVLLPGETEWQKFETGGKFNVPAEARFWLKVAETTDYCCSYVEK